MNNNRVLLLTALLMSAVVSWGQDIALMQNDDGTWRLDAMPAYDVSLQVEYEENDSIPAPADDIFLIQGTDSTWTLPAMPAYDVELVVEYEEEDIPVNPDDILLTDNDDGTWTLAAMPPFDVELMVEYEDEELPEPIKFVTAVEPFDFAQPGEAVTTESGIVISLDDSDTVNADEGSVTLHTTYTTSELESIVSDNVPGSSSFAEVFKGIYFILAAGKGRVELDIETFGNYMMSVVEKSQLIGNYAKTVKGTIVIEYDVDADTWFFAYPSVSTSSGIRRANTSDTDGGLKTNDGYAKIKGFAIAGLDHKFHWADARIDGNDIIVSSPNVTFPVAVRYAWADNPYCNLCNGEGLPAFPFRTDDWPGLTLGKK